MNRISLTVTLLVGLLSATLLNGAVKLQLPEGWEPQSGSKSMTIYATVAKTNGSLLTRVDSRLAIFDSNNVCRGLAELPLNSTGLFILSVSGDLSNGERLTSYVQDAETGTVLSVQERISFNAGQTLGTSGNPVKWHVGTPTDTPVSHTFTLAPGWNLIGLSWDNLTAASANALLAYKPFTVENEAYIIVDKPEQFRSGQAYWLYVQGNASVELTITGIDPSPYGWKGTAPGTAWTLSAPLGTTTTWPEGVTAVRTWNAETLTLDVVDINTAQPQNGAGYLMK